MKAAKQTRLKLRKGFVKAPIQYTVLTVSTLTEEQMKIVAKGLLIATTPEKAKALLPKVAVHKFQCPEWQLKMTTLFGTYDCFVLLYKGLDVAVFWKRQTTKIIPDPEDPVPEGVVENADDVWVRFDLLFKSARQIHSAVNGSIESLQTENTSKQAQIDALKRVADADSRTIKTLQGQIVAQKSKPRKGK